MIASTKPKSGARRRSNDEKGSLLVSANYHARPAVACDHSILAALRDHRRHLQGRVYGNGEA